MAEVVLLLTTYQIEHVSSKWKSVNFKKFNTIKGISKSKLLVKHILHNYKCRFEGKKKKN